MKLPRLCGCVFLGLSAYLGVSPLTSTARADGDDTPHYNKIVLVIEENQQFSTIIGNTSAPFTNWLAEHGALMTQSFGTEHPSQPNYLDLFSGSDQNITDDNHPDLATLPFTMENLGAEVLHSGKTFVGYSEDLPFVGDSADDFAADPADPPGTHDYARKHNPWCNWQNDAFPASPTNLGSNYLPSTVNQPFTPFVTISTAGTFSQLPAVSIIVPNQQHDDHGVTGGLSGNALIGTGDTWLEQNLGAYAAWAKDHNSLLIVTWDEDDYSTTVNQIPTIFYGAHVKTGMFPESGLVTYVSTVNADTGPQGVPTYNQVNGINHWNVLHTIEMLEGLGAVGQANKVEPIRNIFEGDHDWDDK